MWGVYSAVRLAININACVGNKKVCLKVAFYAYLIRLLLHWCFYPNISGHCLVIAACPAFVMTLYSTSKAFQSAFFLWCLLFWSSVFAFSLMWNIQFDKQELWDVSFCKLRSSLLTWLKLSISDCFMMWKRNTPITKDVITPSSEKLNYVWYFSVNNFQLWSWKYIQILTF